MGLFKYGKCGVTGHLRAYLYQYLIFSHSFNSLYVPHIPESCISLHILTACVLPVSFVVHGDYIHGDVILLMWVQTRNFDTHSGEHPPGRKTK